ncbi:rRNA maturation RNase YbeY [Candidatus Gottesmanbacteria bacterium RIFOXYB1_FULL_47_11]|uniref:Endoribonuclease YbeY n=1 Tax=Candidatus Gottesmanbacteria bacterium RIFOXYB1_FULL_47_11 TaxID=1798401 RepID=A0A1F6BCL3_9BACT|nr:MAG: rRNA maturation RNase YbeY [Candidatus Gottesmanbacteria bacterium RIFOXYB1_FULL_47_11]
MIRVLFQTESHFPVNRKKIKDAVETALNGQVHRSAEVSISIVGNRRMRALNKTYRNRDTATDVLSFGQEEGKPFVGAPDDVLRLGDIVVSYPQAVEEARDQNTLVDDQIVVLVLHGLDHLLGKHHPE